MILFIEYTHTLQTYCEQINWRKCQSQYCLKSFEYNSSTQYSKRRYSSLWIFGQLYSVDSRFKKRYSNFSFSNLNNCIIDEETFNRHFLHIKNKKTKPKYVRFQCLNDKQGFSIVKDKQIRPLNASAWNVKSKNVFQIQSMDIYFQENKNIINISKQGNRFCSVNIRWKGELEK